MKRFLLVTARLLLTFICYTITYLCLSITMAHIMGLVPGYLIRIALLFGYYRLSKTLIPIPNSYKQSSLLTEVDVKTEDNASLSESMPPVKQSMPDDFSLQSIEKKDKKDKVGKVIFICSLAIILLTVGVYFFSSARLSSQNKTVISSTSSFTSSRSIYGTDSQSITLPSVAPTIVQQEQTNSPKLNNETVYFLSDGNTYHSEKSCYELSNTKTFSMSSEKYAVSKGLTPCPECIDSNQMP